MSEDTTVFPDLATLLGTAQGWGWSTTVTDTAPLKLEIRRPGETIEVLLTEPPYRVSSVLWLRRVSAPEQLQAILEGRDV